MPLPVEISSLADPRVASYASLTEAQLRSLQHKENAVLIAEGEKVISHALDAGLVPLSFLMEKKHIAGKGAALLERCPQVPVYTGESERLEQLTGFKMSRGFLCEMRRPPEKAPEEILSSARRVAVLEDITDAANVGAIFRNAAALGMDGVLLSPSCADPFCRRSIKVSMGTVFSVPFARFSVWPEEISRLKGAGFTVVALALTESALPIQSPLFRQPERLALLLGTEGDGLRPDTVEKSDHAAIIPMMRGVDSLNVGAAAAIAFWETDPRRER